MILDWSTVTALIESAAREWERLDQERKALSRQIYQIQKRQRALESLNIQDVVYRPIGEGRDELKRLGYAERSCRISG